MIHTGWLIDSYCTKLKSIPNSRYNYNGTSLNKEVSFIESKLNLYAAGTYVVSIIERLL